MNEERKIQRIYPLSRSHIYLYKSTTLLYVVIHTCINILDRVHKSEMFTMIHTTNFEMHKGFKSYLKYVNIVTWFSMLTGNFAKKIFFYVFLDV